MYQEARDPPFDSSNDVDSSDGKKSPPIPKNADARGSRRKNPVHQKLYVIPNKIASKWPCAAMRTVNQPKDCALAAFTDVFRTSCGQN